MKKTILLAIVLIPFLAMAQETHLSKQQSKKNISKLAKLCKKYYSVGYISDSIFLVRDNGNDGLIDLDGNVVFPFDYRIIVQDESDLLVVENDSLMGVIDRQGQWVLPVEYVGPPSCACHRNHMFYDGTMYFAKNGKTGLMDAKGNILLPCKFEGEVSIDKGTGLVKLWQWHDEEEFYGVYITDTEGKTIAGPYDFLGDFACGRALIRQSVNDGYGYIDTKGREVIPCVYDNASVFKNGWAYVINDNTGSIIDTMGNVVLNFDIDSITSIQPLDDFDFAVASRNRSYGALDPKGNVIIPFIYEWYWKINDTYMVMCGVNSDDVYNRKGHLVAQFDNIQWSEDEYNECINNKVFAVNKDSLWGFVDSDMNLIIPYRYKNADYPISDQYCEVTMDDDEKAIIDLSGNIVVKGPYQWLYPVGRDLFCFVSYSHGKGRDRVSIYGYVDRYGNSTASKKEMKLMKVWMDEWMKSDN